MTATVSIKEATRQTQRNAFYSTTTPALDCDEGAHRRLRMGF